MNENSGWLLNYNSETKMERVYNDILRLIERKGDKNSNPIYSVYKHYKEKGEIYFKYLDMIFRSIIKYQNGEDAKNKCKELLRELDRDRNTAKDSDYIWDPGKKNKIEGTDFKIEDGLDTLEDLKKQLERYQNYTDIRHKTNLLIVLTGRDEQLVQIPKDKEEKEVDLVELLINNKQLVLNGAPGTGKTYSARNKIADELLKLTEKNEKEKEIAKSIQLDMVQFHPSYDYTDFIEGIRPTMLQDSTSAGNGNYIGYTLKNGTFKRFCRRAGVIERIIASGETLSVDTIKDFLKGEDDKIIDFWSRWLNGNKGISESDMIKNLPRFLFIIDEINRAEISKVLGETMYCLDADYRGPKGAIATQYAALATDYSYYIDKKNDKFFIPSNVFIIGTMNDIDRSVEVFDFALRRRFAWHEVKANDVMDKVLKEMEIDKALGDNYADYIGRIMGENGENGVNGAIVKQLKLSDHYHLGPSYFAKIDLYLKRGKTYNEARKEVWNNHISQILLEYVKGKRSEAEISSIKSAFVDTRR